ncbi:MAG: hypothetical protein JNL98_18550 [Bryobacterales bacterium]|nr:hypothetical protein [Bryobacterales bacterium]
MTKQNVLWGAIAALLSAASAMAQTSVTFNGGQLALSTTAANQQLKVEVNGNSARLFGFSGVTDGQRYNGVSAILVQTGMGDDNVEFVVESAESLNVQVNTGAGNSTTNVKWKILAGGVSPIADLDIVSGTAGQRNVIVEIESEARTAAVTVDAGAASEIAAKIMSSNFSDNLRVAFAGAAPKTQLEIGSNASTLAVDVRGLGTQLADELKYSIAQSRPASVDLYWNIDSGLGNDMVEAKVSASGSTVTQRGTVLSAGGDDHVLFETDAFSTVTGLSINGGLGNDDLRQIIKGRFQSSQTLQTVMAGGDGNDTLVLTTDTGIFGTGLPNDTVPVLNCGPGIDQFQGFGLIRFCESRL